MKLSEIPGEMQGCFKLLCEELVINSPSLRHFALDLSILYLTLRPSVVPEST